MRRVDLPNVVDLGGGQYLIRARKRVGGLIAYDVKRKIRAASPVDAALEQRRLDAECQAGRYRTNRPLAAITLREWCAHCVEELTVARQWRPATVRAEQQAVARIDDKLLDRRLNALQLEHVERWHADFVARVRNQTISRRTYNHSVGVLRKHLKMAADRGLVPTPHPAQSLVVIRETKGDEDIAREPLTMQHLSLMLGRLVQMDDRLYRGALAYFYLMATTGCRKMEPARSDVRDFDLEGERGWWTLRASVTKTGGKRGTERVPLSDETTALLRAHAGRMHANGPMWVGPRTGERIIGRTVSSWWEQMCAAAGVPHTIVGGGYSITDVRRAAASIYAREYDRRTSAAMLRHDPSVNAKIYDYDHREHLVAPAVGIDKVFATALRGESKGEVH